MFQKLLLFFTTFTTLTVESFYLTRKPVSTSDLVHSRATYRPTYTLTELVSPRTIERSLQNLVSQTKTVFLKPYIFTKYLLSGKKDFRTQTPGPTWTQTPSPSPSPSQSPTSYTFGSW